ncbi:VOC family protein [Nocardioides albidus]|uniref:VOC family protein n=1 Tax=Nocardioides albidus TaxID=1517589 RepID=A0A5C4WRM7_9ACTN|nr:VOC family protein [Nocardioides albidus]TNM50236.1 VOC family protein [Nocardioides albidus]
MAPVRQVQITFDCASPRTVAEFWKAALGYVDPPTPPDADDDSWAACQDPDGVGPRLYFQRVPEPKVAKNRVHLDVRVGTGLVGDERLAALEAEASRLEDLGARRGVLLLADEENESCQNMQDVEGNEFCLD